MRTNIFKTMLVAAAAMAFASCSKDATTDLAPSRELSGVKKNVTITASFESATRTALSDHEITWAEGDTFGILAADDKGVLENIESPEYESGKDTYSVEVPAEATKLYCYYPYSAAYDKLEDIAEFTVNIPNFYSNDAAYSSYGYYDENYAGEFLSLYHYMAAAAEITDEDVDVTFAPLVSIVEFNLYDTTQSGEKFTTFYFSGGGNSKTTGNFTVNFDDNTLTAADAEDGLGIAFAKDKAITLPNTKENGTKLYLVVPKGEYASASFQVGSVDHEYDPSNGYFNNLEWSEGTSFTADGHTVNIDLKHALPAPLAQPLSFTQVEGNPFFATVPVTVQEACDFFAVAVFETSRYNTQKDSRNDEGKNQYDQAVEQLYDAYVTEYLGNNNSSKINNYQYSLTEFYPFLGYNDESITDQTSGPRTLMITEDWQLQYDGHWNTDTKKWDLPGHRNVLRSKTAYTFVAYAKARPSAVNKYGEDFVVYETEFTTPALEFNGSGSIEIDYTQGGSNATAQIKGTNIKKIVTWVVGPKENAPKTPLTADDLMDALTNRTGVYFKDYDGEFTITQSGMNPGDKYYICAAGVDNDGKLVAATPVAAQAADIEFGGYELSKVELASTPTKLGETELTFTVSSDTKYLRIYTSAPKNIDGEAKTSTSDEKKAQTWAEIQGYFKNNTYSANYTEVAVENGTVTTTVSFSEPDQVLSGYDWVDNPGHNPFYFLVVGADAKGDAVTKLGNIYQVTGEYDDPKVEKCTDNIHRGVKENDSSHTVTDSSAYFYSCPTEDFGEAEPEPEVPNQSLWEGTAGFTFYWMTQKFQMKSSDYSNAVPAIWVSKLELGAAAEDWKEWFANQDTTNIYANIWALVDPLYKDFESNQEPSSYITRFTNVTASTYSTYDYPDCEEGDVYIAVSMDKNNKLKAVVGGIYKNTFSGNLALRTYALSR